MTSLEGIVSYPSVHHFFQNIIQRIKEKKLVHLSSIDNSWLMILQMNTRENTDALTSTETLTTFMVPHKFTETKGSKQMRFEQIVFNLVTSSFPYN